MFSQGGDHLTPTRHTLIAGVSLYFLYLLAPRLDWLQISIVSSLLASDKKM
jgi:hypothetical protein